MGCDGDSLEAHDGEDVTKQPIQPEVQKYLEAVYAVAPCPEQYVRYRLHLATALPLPLIDSWFEKRRQAASLLAAQGALRLPEGFPPEFAGQQGLAHASGLFLRLDGLEAHQACQKELANGWEAAEEVADVGRALTMMQNARKVGGMLDATGRISCTEPAAMFGQAASAFKRNEPVEKNANAGRIKQPAPSMRANKLSRDDAATASCRFVESDLETIASLVGLETITSAQEHCGSNALYMFEQLTALDSLDIDGMHGTKRRRTRHQHFWRNTDKLDPEERVYVPTTSIKPALTKSEYVVSKSEISPEERTNAWTVCLTTKGVVSYLNKRISPLGVRMIRALQGRGPALNGAQQSQPLPWGPSRDPLSNRSHSHASTADDASASADDLGIPTARTRRVVSERNNSDFTSDTREELQSGTQCHGVSGNAYAAIKVAGKEGEGLGMPADPDMEKRHLEAATTLAMSLDSQKDAGFEPVPRARKRKPG